MEKLRISCPIIVEGKYDREKLLSVCEATVLTTDGFGIFKKPEKQALFRRLSEKSRLIILSDSDGAGSVIRSFLKSTVPAERLIQLYIPQIEGKEKRKTEASKEGFLGVEGMERELLYRLLEPFADGSEPKGYAVSKAELYAAGLCGRENSGARRDAFCALAGLPRGMTPNALSAAIGVIMTKDEFDALVSQLK